MNKKNNISENDEFLELKVLTREKEDVRKKLVVTAGELKEKASNLAVIAREKEHTRIKLVATAKELKLKAKQLAFTAKGKEEIRLKLVTTAKQLAIFAKEREDVRKKLVITANALAQTAREKENVRRKLEMTTKEKQNEVIAARNVLEDLNIEKSRVEVARAKEQAILRSIGEGQISIDQGGNISTINKAAEEMLGFKSKEIIGKPFFETIILEDEKGVAIVSDKLPLNMALAAGITTTGANYYYVKKNKTKFPVAITTTPIMFNEKIIGAIEVFRDVTREIEIDKAKSEFVSLASHQLRTPLGIIKWYLEVLENEDYFKKAPDVIKKYISEIYSSNERVLSLVRDLLSVSRIEQRRVKNVLKSADLVKVVMEIVEQMQIVARKKKVSLHLVIQDRKIPTMIIDVLRFREVIENLIVNAIEYTSAKGSVNVNIKKVRETLLISVKDTGIGISQVDQKKLFAKFFRSGKAIRNNPEGSGLGLYVVKSYVEGWGGKIAVESVEEKGSTFTISLPILRKRMYKGGLAPRSLGEGG